MARKPQKPPATPKPPAPGKLANAGLGFLAALATKGVDPGRMQRETEGLVTSWLEGPDPSEARARALEAAELLFEQLAAGVEQTAEQVADIDRSDAAGVRAGERSLAGLQAALEALGAARKAL